MNRGVSYPENRGDKRCKRAFDFGIQRGRKAAYGVRQDKFPVSLLCTPERMAYYRGYARAYRATKFRIQHPRVDDEFRRQQHGT